MLTAMADEFGGPIPVGPFALIGDDSIGAGHRGHARAAHRSPAVLMQNHGVFTIGAVREGRGQGRRHGRGRRPHRAPVPPARRADPDRARPTSTRSTPATRTSTDNDERGPPVTAPFEGREVWFLTGSQDLYGEETLQQVAEQSQRVAAALDDAAEVPVRVVWKPVLKDAGRDPPGHGRGQRGRRLPRRHHLDAHLLAGQDVDRRPGRAAQAAAAPAHPGRRRPAVGDDRHGLHEPQPGRPRRPGVRLRCSPGCGCRGRRCPGTCPTRAVRARVGSLGARGRGCRGGRGRCSWPGSATTCATSR